MYHQAIPGVFKDYTCDAMNTYVIPYNLLSCDVMMYYYSSGATWDKQSTENDRQFDCSQCACSNTDVHQCCQWEECPTKQQCAEAGRPSRRSHEKKHNAKQIGN